MSKLLAYNLTGAPLSLAAGNPVVPDLPASAAPPARGPAVNVTAELQNLTGPDYVALQAQVDAGDVAFAWDGYPNYETPGLETESPVTGAGGDVLGSPIIWRHDAVSPPPGVYSTFEEAHAEAVARIDAGLGKQTIIVDRTESTNISLIGVPSCPVPVGAWDMTDIGLRGEGASVFQFLSIPEGAYLDNLSRLSGSGSGYLIVLNEAQVAGGIRTSGTFSILEGNVLFRSPDAASLPAIQNQGFTQLVVEASATLFVGYFDFLSPVIDTAGGDFIVVWNGGGFIRDQALTDSVGGGVFDFQLSSEGNGTSSDSSTWDQPGLSGSLVFGDINISRSRWKQLLGPVGFGASPYDASAAAVADIYDVDTSGGSVVIGMPRSAPIAGETFIVCDVTGNAEANPVTVKCFPGDRFKDNSTQKVLSEPFGALVFVSDGFGFWRQIQRDDTYGYDATGYSGGAATNAAVSGGVAEPGPAANAAAGWAQQIVTIPGAAPTGDITAVAPSLLLDTDNFVLDDGVNPAVTYEFDSDNSVVETSTLRQVPYGFAVTADLTYIANRGDGNGRITGADFTGVIAGQTVVISGTASNNVTATALSNGNGSRLDVVGAVLTNEGPVTSTVTQEDTADNTALAIADAVDGTPLIYIDVDSVTAAVVDLIGVVGTEGNNAIVENVDNAGFAVTGMAGGVHDLAAKKWVQYWD